MASDDRRRAEREIIRQLEEALRIARLGSWEWDIAHDRVYWSEQLCRIWGVDPDTFEASYAAYLDHIHPDDRAEIDRIVQHAYATGDAFETLHRIVRPDGEIRVIRGRGAVFLGDDGKPVRMAGTAQDITEQAVEEARERELAREQARAQELERSNRELEQFAYVASHDLQEPLRTVAGYLQLLERRHGGALDDEAREFIGFAIGGTNRMQRLIEDLLAYSRVTTKGRAFTPVSVDDVLAEAEDNLARRIEDTGAQIARRGPLPTVRGDRPQLVQLFQNLLSNAIKFAGDAPPRIRVGAERVADRWEISVEDDGIGFDPKHAERVFAVFQRAHGREYEGTGIGLAICKKIVERHEGTISVTSAPGQGTAFRFALRSTEPA